jgi:hypothetical protein
MPCNGRSYRRWLKTGLLIFLWCGVAPIVFSGGYYALRKPADFDPLLSQLRDGQYSGQNLAWAIRIGSSSSRRNGIGWRSTYFGFIVDDSEGERHHTQVTDETLAFTSCATYLAKFNRSAFPTVMTAFRDVTPDQRISYSMERYGLKPARSYLVLMAAVSIFAAILFELRRHRREHRATAS